MVFTIHVAEDRSVSGVVPPEVPPGEHRVEIADGIPQPDRQLATDSHVPFPTFDIGPWPEGLDLRLSREWIYGDDGR